MWGSGHALIWITCLLFSLYRSSLPHDIKDVSLLLLPHSLSTCQSFLVSTNQWKWPIHVPFSFLILNQFLSCVVYHIQWHQGSWKICRHLTNISKSCDLTAWGQGHFTQSQTVAWAMDDVCLCALLTLLGHVWCVPLCIADTPGDWLASFLLAVQSRQSCWNCK